MCYSTSGVDGTQMLHTVGSGEIIDIYVVIEIQVSDTYSIYILRIPSTFRDRNVLKG